MTRQISSCCLLAALLLGATPAWAQSMDEVVIGAEPIRHGVYLLTGRGGNMGLVVGEEQVLLIDTQFAPLTDRIVETIAGITELPPRLVLNTHWHGDHTGGNANLAERGAILVAHEKVRQRMATEQVSLFFDRTTPPAPAAALPTLTFADSLSFELGGQTARVIHIPAAHTDGDAIVHLPEANVIHTGDIVFYGLYPFIDVDSGGRLVGVIEAVDQIAALADADTVIIPGHGPLIDREQLIGYGAMLRTVHDRLRAAIDAGQPLEDIQAAGITAEYDEFWGGGFIPPARWVALLYRSLTEG